VEIVAFAFLTEPTYMDIDNDPIVCGKGFLFCEEGNHLAQQFIKAARSAVRLAGTADPCELRENLDRALAEWFGHRYLCPDCLSHPGIEPVLPLNSKYLH
jgi:hypothetical protein